MSHSKEGALAARARFAEREVQEGLARDDIRKKVAVEKLKKTAEERQQYAAAHGMEVQERVETYKGVEHHLDLEGLFKGMKRVEKSEKDKNKILKE